MTTPVLDEAERRDWMAVVAKADFEVLEPLWSGYSGKLHFEELRKPETGLVMVRGRMGGTGQPFNLGEATVTRCSVRSNRGHIGHAYLLGRDRDHARFAAEIDAAMQDEDERQAIKSQVLSPLRNLREDFLQTEREKTAATKVDFFTMVRGENE